MLALGNSFITYIRRYTDIEVKMKTKNRRVASSCYEKEKKVLSETERFKRTEI